MQHTEKRPREMILRREFAQAVGYLNQILPEDKKLKFIHWDFHKFAKTLVKVFVVNHCLILILFLLIFFFYKQKNCQCVGCSGSSS